MILWMPWGERHSPQSHSAAVRPQPKIDAPLGSSHDGYWTSHREEHPVFSLVARPWLNPKGIRSTLLSCHRQRNAGHDHRSANTRNQRRPVGGLKQLVKKTSCYEL